MAKKKYEDYLKELQNLPINDKQEDNAINNKKEIAPTRTTIAQKNISAPVWEKNNNIAPIKTIKQNEEQFKQEQENYESKKTKEDYLKELQNLKFDSDKEKKKIFDAGAFEDGYQPGDVIKTILGTGANALSAVGQGMMGISDSAAKLVVGGVAQVADWTGNTEYATKLRDRIAGKDEVTNERLKKYTPLGWFESAKEATDKDSVLGEVSQDILNGAGYYGGMAALQTVGVPWQVTAGVTSAGGELSNAYANDAEDWEAWTSAVVNALAEIGSEYISGGVKLPGTGKTMEKLTGNLVNNIKNKYLKGLAGFGINMAGEGFEENVSGIVSEMTRRLTYMKDEEKGLIENALNGAKDYISQQALSDFVNGSIVAGLTMGVNPGTYKNIKTGRSLITGLTTEEQNRIQQEVDNVIKERTENGETITNKEINAIEEEVKNEILNEIYNNQKDITDNLEEFNQQQQELKTQQQTQKNNQRIENIENQVNQINEELQNSFFNYDPNAKRYNDLQNTNTIEFNTKDNGNIKVALKDSKNNLINEISLDNKENAIKELGNDIGNYIVNNATNKPQNIEINKTINNNENVENNSPKSFKEQQLDIIKETNPMEDEYHVGIRNVNDIKTFEEAINDNESFAWGDYTKEDAIRDLNKGSVMVYSSKPIVNGNFVSTSYQQAYEYAGHDKSKVYSKEVPINDVAWINGDEGQYARVNKSIPTIENNSNNNYNNIKRSDNDVGRTNEINRTDSLLQDKSDRQNGEYNNSNQEQEDFERNRYVYSPKSYDVGSRTIREVFGEEARTNVNSNGKKLTEDQNDFYSNDMVRNADGNLLVVYHGTKEQFDSFDKSKIGSNTHNVGIYGCGFYFTENKALASNYNWGENVPNNYEPMALYVNITNPFYWNGIKTEEQMNEFIQKIGLEEGILTWNRYDQEIHTIKEENKAREFSKKLQENGYDGIIYKHDHGQTISEIVAFEPNQIKSVDNLHPTTESDNIYERTNESSFSLKERVSGDTLLDALDLIDEVKSVGAKVDDNGYITLYHQTTNENAKKIRETGKMSGKENGIFFSTSKNASQAYGRGQTKLEFKIPAEKLLLDDLFSDNADLKIESKPGEQIDVSNYLVNDIKSSENEEIAPIGNYHIKGEDIKPQDIAPIESMNKGKVEETKAETKTNAKEEIELPFDYEEPIGTSGLDDKTINKITNNLKSELSLNPYEISEFKKTLSDISKNDSITKEEITNLLEKKFGEKEYKVKIDEIANIKKELKNTKIFVPDYIKIDIPDYSDFRQRNYNKLGFSKDGRNIDSVYKDLAEAHPDYFDNDIINPSDQLQEMARIANLDKYITDTAYLDESKIENAANWIYDSIEDYDMQQQVKQGTLGYNEYLEKSKQKDMKKTRNIVQNELEKEMGITIPDLEVGKDISALEFQRTDPIRVNEKVFGAKVGDKVNDATIRKTNHNEAKRTRFLNKEREEIKNLGIKPRSEESAAVQKYGEKQYVNLRGKVVKYGDTELAKEFPDVATQNKIKNAAKFIRNKYDSYIDEINKSITEMGYDPIPKRQDYMRHFQEIGDKLSEWGVPLNRDSLSKDTLPTDINGITDQFKPGKNWFASAMERKGIKTTYDAITGIDGYLEGASNLIYHTADIQRYRTLSKLIRNTYGQTHGMDNIDPSTKEGQQRLNNIMDNKLSKYAAWLDEQANALAGKKGGIDRAAERLLGRKIYTILDSAKKQVGSNMTGFNVRSALTNFASAVQGASKTNKMSFIKGTISTIKNMINNDGLIDKSDFLTNRFGSDQLSKKLWQKASNAGQILMTGTDYFTANQIWRSKYFENLSKGMNEQQAIKKADDFASRIMGDRSKGMTAEIFNSKTLGLLTQFQLEVNNQWSSIVHDNKMDLQRGNKSGASVIFQLGQLAAMSFMFNNFMKAMTGSDVMIDPIDMLRELFGANDDDDEETTLEERSQKVLGDIVNDLPFASFMTGGRIPISEAFTGAGTLGKKLTGQKDQFGNDISWDDVKDDAISSAFYWLLPTGYGQLKKTSKGISMYNEELPLPGSYTNSGNLRFAVDDTPGDRIKAALFGEYSSKEAQKYRDSGYKTINASKIDLLKELNMSSSEFRKIQDKISEASETTTKKDGVTYNKYFDNDGKTYWYNKDSKKLYDENFNASNKNVLNLEKAEKNELLFDYISDLYLNEQQKQKLFHEYFTNTTTDQYGFEKYTDEKNKTYWYDKDKQTLYDSKYNIVKDKKISSLKKVNKEKDLTNYNDYGSYEEANFAITEPGKYLTSKTTTNSYKNYKKYTEDIANISADKDKNGKSIPNSKKKKVVEYISNLNEDYGSKIILYKMYYPKDNSYNSQIIKYLNSLDSISDKDERTILKYLGMKVSDDGTVRW